MLSTTKPSPHRPSIHIPGTSSSTVFDLYSDARDHGYKGPTRTVRLPRATSGGVGAIAKSEDGQRCAVAGQDSLRILRLSEPAEESASQDHKCVVGYGGHRIDASRNLWTGSGLKIDSASTDVVWGHGVYNNKILTSARNGELIMWDLNKSGSSKYERKTKDHLRAIHKIGYSQLVPYYCVTASADENLRVWDLRTMSRSINRIRLRAAVRTVVLSPNTARPLEAIVGLDNGSISRWDLQKGQLGQLDLLPVAHAGPILSLDWCMPTTHSSSGSSLSTSPSLGELAPGGNPSAGGIVSLDNEPGGGWLVSGGMDRCVKVWDLTNSLSTGHMPHKPTYTLSTSFPVRSTLWRPSYECEIAVVSNADGTNAEGKQDQADEIEIWDVRRGSIAKWQVMGSAVDGGATDVVWRDAHAMWAHHSSGTFSQLDVRHSIKPLDSIPRVAVDWQATGALAFVADRRPKWEVPYDDIEPGKRPVAQERGSKIKALGDPPYFPVLQSVGAFITDDVLEDTESFVKLAKNYVITGSDRISICQQNADLAFSVSKDEAAHAWLLMASLLSELIPEAPPTLPLTPVSLTNPPLPHSRSAPASIPILKRSPQPDMPSRRASSSDLAAQGHEQHSSPSPSRRSGSGSKYSSERTVYPPQRRNTPASTPASSTSPSPRRVNVALPPPAPRRDSSTSLFKPRSLSIYGRPSTSMSASVSRESGSPSDSVKSHLSSLRHVGEGALDDSDSSGEEGEIDGDGLGKEDPSPSRASQSSHSLAHTTATPSPLSRESQEWPDEEEDEEEEDDSPSPASTDTDGASDNDNSSPERKSRRSVSRRQLRSRSSTMASLAAASSSAVSVNVSVNVRPPVARQESYSSIRTVVAEAGGTGRDDTVRDRRSASGDPSVSSNARSRMSRMSGSSRTTSRKASPVSHTHTRQVSSEYNLNSEMEDGTRKETSRGRKREREKGREDVKTRERMIREVGWGAVREGLEVFADTGDVQMCAFMCLIAPEELGVGNERVTRFLEAYIEILSRLRLHAPAAFIRKQAKVDEIQATTMVQTTVHLSCGNCRKTIFASGSTRRPCCSSCQAAFSRCSICHLPVKTLFFQCPVCTHGGHQSCYRQYYSQRPLVELPSSEPRGRTQTRRDSPMMAEDGLDSMSEGGSGSNNRGTVERMARLSGHPCAAGCGHFCWIASEGVGVEGEGSRDSGER
ncbi:WD40 repeat-like protein [Neolentinus lepideus HHB14362 ss-1]|uniref:WD40 repeat-like protein n=1 Tax=Neolentinus lepideus HHB14362 ss-1 TaxID=1314782 RepID=A0A165QTV3_9AGAM|nr:WD40 repeat-like protein [Neolentinus lepideus HHB14362 ss-1]